MSRIWANICVGETILHEKNNVSQGMEIGAEYRKEDWPIDVFTVQPSYNQEWQSEVNC